MAEDGLLREALAALAAAAELERLLPLDDGLFGLTGDLIGLEAGT